MKLTKHKLFQEIAIISDESLKEVLNFLLDSDQQKQSNSFQTFAVADASYSTTKPIWESLSEFAENLPHDVIQDLPQDGAVNLDSYLYGNFNERG
jgi:hypothetical protein